MSARLFDFVQITCSSAQSILANYDLGEFISVSKCSGGIINSNYRLETTDGKFLLRVYNSERSLKEIEFELNALSALAASQFESQRPMLRRDGSLFSKIGLQNCALLTFLLGRNLEDQNLTPTISRQVGSAVARMQNALDGHNLAESKQNADYCFIRRLAEETIQELAKRPDLVKVVETLKQQLSEAEKIFREGRAQLKKGLVHADISPENVLFDAGAFKGLIDFDDSYVGWLAGDVALTLMEFSFNDEQLPSMELAKQVLEGYSEHRALGSEEAALLVPLMKLLCLKYFCYLLPLAQGVSDEIINNPYLRRLGFKVQVQHRRVLPRVAMPQLG